MPSRLPETQSWTAAVLWAIRQIAEQPDIPISTSEVLHVLGRRSDWFTRVAAREFPIDGFSHSISQIDEVLTTLGQIGIIAPVDDPDSDAARAGYRVWQPERGWPYDVPRQEDAYEPERDDGGNGANRNRNDRDGDGGGGGGAGGAGGGDGGAGIREVLAHPVLFSLPDSDFDTVLDRTLGL
jgi:hypothetical protein